MMTSSSLSLRQLCVGFQHKFVSADENEFLGGAINIARTSPISRRILNHTSYS